MTSHPSNAAPTRGTQIVRDARPATYADGRPSAHYRLDTVDHGVVLRHGGGPGDCDALGARDVWVWQHAGKYYMHYDGAGPHAWLACLAESDDGINWTKRGPVLDLGPPGSEDAKSASYGVTYFDGGAWHLFYLGTPNTTPPPDRVPAFPYLTMKARADSPAGPWTKQPQVVPFRTNPGTYYSITASPGHVVPNGDAFVQFFSATTEGSPCVRRTLGIARTADLDGPWAPDAGPIVPSAEQVENASLYFEPTSATWFLFTNHIGTDSAHPGSDGPPGIHEYTDAVWVYWSKTLDQWNPEHKAVVLDGRNCTWNQRCIGLPSVVPVGNRLALYYDAPRDPQSKSHMARDVGLAWIELPIRVADVP